MTELNVKLIDEYLDYLEHKAGKKNKYQYFLLFLGFFIFFNYFLVMGVSPLYEDMPSATIYNKISKETITDVQITKELCRDKKVDIISTNKRGFSMASELKFYCDDLMMGMMNVFLFGGIVVAMLLLPVCNEILGRKNTIMLTAFLNLLVCICTVFSTKPLEAFFGIFLYNATGMITAQTTLLLVQESVSNSQRSLYSTLVTLGYIPCMALFDIIMVALDSWEISFLISAGLSVIQIIIVKFYVLESWKTHLKRKDYESYLVSLLELAKINGRKDKFLKFLVSNKENFFLDNVYDENFIHFKKLKSLISDEDVTLMQNMQNSILGIKQNLDISIESQRHAKSVILNIDDKDSDDEENDDDAHRRKTLYTNIHPVNDRLKQMIKMEEQRNEKSRGLMIDSVQISGMDHNENNKDSNKKDKFHINFKSLRHYFGYTNNKINNNETSIIIISNKDTIDNNSKDIDNSITETKEKFENKLTSESINDLISKEKNNDKNNNIIEEKQMTNDSVHSKIAAHNYSPKDLLQFSSQRMKFLTLSIIWFICCGMFFGNTINLKNLPGSILTIGLINSAVEGVGYFSSGFIMNTKLLGRIKSNTLYYIISFTGYLILAIFNLSNSIVIMISFIVKCVLAASLNSMFVISGESYPNTIKNYGYSFNTATGKFGALICTFILEQMTAFQVNLMFSIMGAINIILLMFIKETRGLPLESDIPELIADEEKKAEIEYE